MTGVDASAAALVAIRFGVVLIGRNEGERLLRCLRSVCGPAARVVYVDSASTDGSVAAARAMGATVCTLDAGEPFTAARARNIGFGTLIAEDPTIDAVQFVDGDCEVVPGWLDEAARFLGSRPDVAAVCGRRRERFPAQSIYNRLCDIEWDTPVGEARACGGDAMIRVAAFSQIGGYRADLIAGEEPELCLRLRRAGWRIWRLDAEMTHHDAAMLRFAQWWKRAMRGGYAFAEGAHLHGAPPERHWVRESRSAWVWGAALPLLALLGFFAFGSSALWILAIYPLQVARLATAAQGTPSLRLARAFFLVLGKFAEAAGQLKFTVHRLSGTRGRLIEYK